MLLLQSGPPPPPPPPPPLGGPEGGDTPVVLDGFTMLFCLFDTSHDNLRESTSIPLKTGSRFTFAGFNLPMLDDQMPDEVQSPINHNGKYIGAT
jgi:hypothetical protein